MNNNLQTDNTNALRVFSMETWLIAYRGHRVLPSDSIPPDGHLILNQLRRCEHELHSWGAANSVTFDPSNESFDILSHDAHFGNSFRLLDTVIEECCAQAHWRLSSLLRSRRFFSISDLMTHDNQSFLLISNIELVA